MTNHRPTWVEIDLNALRHNLAAIKRRVGPQIKIMGIVKADAYGHGDLEVSRTLLNNGVESLGVAILEEGICLRNKGIKEPLLVFSGIFEDQLDAIIQYDLTPTVYDAKLAVRLSQKAAHNNKTVKIHIYVDTGMGSIGIKHNNAVDFVMQIKGLKNLAIEGIYTHCACSDEKDSEYTLMQIKRFRDVLKKLEAMKVFIPIKHMANSGAILRYPETYFTMVRPGLSLYGLYPSEEVSREIGLKPVMSFKSRIVHIKNMEPGEFVGYGMSYKITKPSRIATLPLGYDDGYNRLLSNQGLVIIRGTKAPIIGRVCMDQCFADITHIKDASVGDEVVLYGTQGCETISIESVAKQLNTIPYEITCAIGKRVPRIYIN